MYVGGGGSRPPAVGSSSLWPGRAAPLLGAAACAAAWPLLWPACSWYTRHSCEARVVTGVLTL